MREFACARCGTKLASENTPPSALCPNCQFVNVILPSTEKVNVLPDLLKEIHLSKKERQVAYPEFAGDETCQKGLPYVAEKEREDLIRLIMHGRKGWEEKEMWRVRAFRSRGRRDRYWRKVAEITAKARIRDFLEKAWKYL